MPDRDVTSFDFISPLDARYYGTDKSFFDALHPYLSEQATLTYQLKVEQAIVAELEQMGVAPPGASALVAQAVSKITPADIYAQEQRIQHNIRALVNCIRERLPAKVCGYVHLFATSNDIMDTARSVALRDACREVVVPDLYALIRTIIARARDYAGTIQIGRTHGRYAEPITVGYWLANYVERLGTRAELIVRTAGDLRGKFSGSVGAHNALALNWPDDPAAFESRMLSRLGLRPSDNCISTQVVHAERLTDLGHALVSTYSVFANLADDFRHLMRSEIDELQEMVDAARVGSSTMPHKVNPKNFENVKSLWKAFMPRMITLYLDQVCEHQRALTNSASGRFFNELLAIVDYAARRLRAAIEQTDVCPEAIDRNLSASSDWIVAEPLYIALALDGHPDPYGASRSLVVQARERGEGLLTFLTTNDEAQKVLARLTPVHREIVLDPRKYIGDAEVRTRLVCDAWEAKLDHERLAEALSRPPEHQALVVHAEDPGHE
ncbi:MAG: lyase family protein [Phycisphaerae bacterium]